METRRVLMILGSLVASALIAAALLWPRTEPASAGIPTLLGDVDCNEVVTIADAQLIAQLIVGRIPNLACVENGDVNASGGVTIADAQLIAQLIVGRIPSLPPLPLPTATPQPPDDGTGPPPISAEPTLTESGLQIFDIEVGTGATVEAGDTITVHYTGWLEDGTEFDSSVGGLPVSFPLDALIEGWQEGITGMQPGGKRRLIIPPELAYGEAGRPGIPPNSTLTFDIELFSIQ